MYVSNILVECKLPPRNKVWNNNSSEGSHMIADNTNPLTPTKAITANRFWNKYPLPLKGYNNTSVEIRKAAKKDVWKFPPKKVSPRKKDA